MVNITITSFNTGVVTPHLHARVDIEKYAAACRVLENMLPLVYGDVTRRPGTEYIATSKGEDVPEIRLIPFIYSAEITYMCEFGNLYIRFYFDGAPLLSGGAPVEVSSPYISDDLPQLQIKQIGDTMWIVHPNYAPRKLTRTSATAFSLDTIAFETGPFLTRNDLDDVDGIEDATLECDETDKDATGTLTAASGLTFEPGHVGSIWKIVQDRDTVSVAAIWDATPADRISDPLDVKGTFSFATVGAWFGTLKLERSIDQGDTWDAYRIWVNTKAAVNFTLSAVEKEPNVQYRINGEGLDDRTNSNTYTSTLSVDASAWEGIVRFDAYLTSTTATVTILTKLITADETTLRWAEGAWSAVRGYPAAVAFFENRIVYGGTANDPQKIWPSATDDYEDFDDDVQDDDSFDLAITSTNDIRWIEALDALAIGLSGDEWRIGSTRLEEPLTPTNFNAKQQTTHGSADLQAVKVNNVVLFVDYTSRRVREFTFNADRQQYVAPDLTELAEHITASGIVGMAYQKSPDSILWCWLRDGSLISQTYQRAQNVVAWARHPLQTDALVESAAVIPGDAEDEIWLAVVRTIGGETVRYIERMRPRAFATQADAFFVDSGLSGDGQGGATTFSGLDHLEGETVSILGDGAVFPEQVVTDGSITIASEVEKVSVGLPYRYVLQPLRIEIGTQRGASRASLKNIPELGLSLLDTLGLQYGDSLDDLHTIDWRTTEPYDDPPEMFTGDKQVALDGGFSLDIPIVLSGADPLPCTIRAITAKIEVTGR